jgi:hypothetical protein
MVCINLPHVPHNLSYKTNSPAFVPSPKQKCIGNKENSERYNDDYAEIIKNLS